MVSKERLALQEGSMGPMHGANPTSMAGSTRSLMQHWDDEEMGLEPPAAGWGDSEYSRGSPKKSGEIIGASSLSTRADELEENDGGGTGVATTAIESRGPINGLGGTKVLRSVDLGTGEHAASPQGGHDGDHHPSTASSRASSSQSCREGRPVMSTRRWEDNRRLSLAGPPPPPRSPPPLLVRRASHRETAPNARESSSAGHVKTGRWSNSAHDKSGAVHNKHKERRDGSCQVLQASGPNRTSHTFPPPTDSPPRASFHGGGVVRRRSPPRSQHNRVGSSSFVHGHRRGRNNKGNSSRSNSSSSSSSSSGISDFGCSSSSVGGNGKTHVVDDPNDVDEDGNAGQGGRHTPPFLGNGHLVKDVRGGRKHVRESRAVDHDEHGSSEQVTRGVKQAKGEKGGRGRNDISRENIRVRDDGGRRRLSTHRASRQQEEADCRPPSRSEKHHKRRPGGWTDENVRSSNPPSPAAIRKHRDRDVGDRTGGVFPGHVVDRESSARLPTDSSGGGKIHSLAEARGSDTTATPSPRDTGGGSVGEMAVDGVNEGGMGWLEGPADISYQSCSPWQKAHVNGCGGDFNGTQCSKILSPKTIDAARQTSVHSSSGFLDDDQGIELRGSAAEDTRNGSSEKSLGDDAIPNIKESLQARGQDENEAHLRARLGRARSPVGNKGWRKSKRNDGEGGNRRDRHRHDRPRFDSNADEDRPESALTNSSGGASCSSDGGGRCSDNSCGDGKLKTPSRASKRRGSVVRSSRRADGGWFTVEGDAQQDGSGIGDGSNTSSPRNTESPTRQGGGVEQAVALSGADGTEDGGSGGNDGDRGRGVPTASQRQGHVRCSSLMLSYERGRYSDMVQCVIVRDRSGMNRLYPQYRFYFEEREEQLMMVAQKCSKNRTSNYHVFDMHRAGVQTRLSKKSGNYLGKVRTNLKRTEATVFTNDQEVAELGAIAFEKPGIVDHLREGSQPRKFSVLLPSLDFDGAPVAHKVDPYDTDSNMGRHGSMFLLQTREPTFRKGNYRLNFHGRVTVPSVKNFQLVSPDDTLHTVCQFGKVGEGRFHLDYRAPINAFQAFCISLAQFNF